MRDFREIIEEVMAETEAVAKSGEPDFVMATNGSTEPASPRDIPVSPGDSGELAGGVESRAAIEPASQPFHDPVEIDDVVLDQPDLQPLQSPSADPAEIEVIQSAQEDEVSQQEIRSPAGETLELTPVRMDEHPDPDLVPVRSAEPATVSADGIESAPVFDVRSAVEIEPASWLTAPEVASISTANAGESDVTGSRQAQPFSPQDIDDLPPAEQQAFQSAMSHEGELRFHEIAEEQLEAFRVQIDELIRPEFSRIRHAAMGAIHEQVSEMAYRLEERHMQ